MKRMKTKAVAIFAAMVLASSITTAVAAAPSVSAVTSVGSYVIVAGAASGGSISPNGTISVAPGGSQTINITPDAGYAINEVIVNGTSVGAVSSYTFSNVSSNNTLVASFRQANESSYDTRLLKTDTRSYAMSPGDIYDVRITVEGANISQNDVKVTSSRSGIASVQQVTQDTYRVTGLSAGTTYVTAEVGGTHASIRFDVQPGVQQGGESCRSVSVISQDYVSVGDNGGWNNNWGNTGGNNNWGNTGGNNNWGNTGTTTGITAEQAKTIALNHAKVNASSVSFVRAHLDYENGRQVYDVEFYSNYNEYDYEIDAATGTIISYDFDIENYSGGQVSTPSGLISQDRAKQIALSNAGLSASSVSRMEVGLDYEYGMAIYEISFRRGWMEYDYEINAQTGAIIKAEREYDD